MSKELYRVFNDNDEMRAFMNEVGGCWSICKDGMGKDMVGTYYVKYKPKPSKREFIINNIRPATMDPSIALGDYEGKRVWGGELLKEFVGEKVKITIEVVGD